MSSAQSLKAYPPDPLSEQQLLAHLLSCVSGQAQYKAYSDKIVQTCMPRSATPPLVQQAAIDRIKEVI